jgi:hypothetical protein
MFGAAYMPNEKTVVSAITANNVVEALSILDAILNFLHSTELRGIRFAARAHALPSRVPPEYAIRGQKSIAF